MMISKISKGLLAVCGGFFTLGYVDPKKVPIIFYSKMIMKYELENQEELKIDHDFLETNGFKVNQILL